MVEMKAILEVIKNADVVDDMNDFDVSKSFKENGIDSLDAMGMFLSIEEAFGIKFSEEDYEKVHTAIDLQVMMNNLK